MNVTQDLSILSLVTNASVPVQLVMALLLSVSFTSWLFIFRKLFAIRQAGTQTEKFERDFFSALHRDTGGNLSEMSRQCGLARSSVREYVIRYGLGDVLVDPLVRHRWTAGRGGRHLRMSRLYETVRL